MFWSPREYFFWCLKYFFLIPRPFLEETERSSIVIEIWWHGPIYIVHVDTFGILAFAFDSLPLAKWRWRGRERERDRGRDRDRDGKWFGTLDIVIACLQRFYRFNQNILKYAVLTFSSLSLLVNLLIFIEGSLEVKLPTIWRDEEAVSREKSLKRKDQKKEDAGARKGRKVAKHCVFPVICGSGGSKSRLAKVAGAEPCGQMRDEKLHAVVARSTFPTQNVQNTPASDHFWKLRCRKSARRCGAKHISKSKCTIHLSSRALLEVEMFKQCTLLWREAHFKVKMYKALHFRITFGSWDVEKARAVVAWNKFWSQNGQTTSESDHF